MKLTPATLPDYFTIADNLNGWFDQPTNTYDFVSVDSKTLVVTIGDSWTWGCDLSLYNSNNELRQQQVFGRRLAEHLSADWLNLAIPAVGNRWIADRVAELAKIIPDLDYSRIVVVCTFSEVGRGFNTHLDSDIDYVAWFKENIKSADDFNLMLAWMNQQVVDRIVTLLAPYTQVELRVGTSTVEAIGLDCPGRLEQPWYQVAGITSTVPAYFGADGIKGLLQVPEFLSSAQKTWFKEWMLSIMPAAEARTELLRNSPVLTNFHPGAAGHQAWADYIKDSL